MNQNDAFMRLLRLWILTLVRALKTKTLCKAWFSYMPLTYLYRLGYFLHEWQHEPLATGAIAEYYCWHACKVELKSTKQHMRTRLKNGILHLQSTGIFLRALSILHHITSEERQQCLIISIKNLMSIQEMQSII